MWIDKATLLLFLFFVLREGGRVIYDCPEYVKRLVTLVKPYCLILAPNIMDRAPQPLVKPY
jgi:hypothetical protein